MTSGNGSLRRQLDRRSPASTDLPSTPSASRSTPQNQIYAQFPCEHCGKQYSTVHHLEAHQRASCNASKRNISELLLSTKEFWESKKRRRLAENQARRERSAPLEDSHTSGQPDSLISSLAGDSSSFADQTGSSDLIPSSLETLDAPVALRKGKREVRLPARYRQEDTLPQALPPIDFRDIETVDEAAPQVTDTEPSATRVSIIHQSKRNVFGIVRAYRTVRGSLSSHDPDQLVTLRDLTDSTSASAEPSDAPYRGRRKDWGPFSNKSSFTLADWYWESKNKSFTDFQKLISVLNQPDFSIADTTNVNWKAAFKALGANREDLPEHEAEWIHDDGWKSTPLTINVPFHHRMRKPGFDNYLAGSFRHRNLVSVIKEKISNPKDSASFHYQPYQATWKPTDDGPDVELYGEVYASRAFRQAHEEVEALPSNDRNHGLERVVVAMMLWSDGTQLTSFGGASLWPCYLFFGNESKYRRCRPSERLGEQVAYFTKLSDSFDDYLRKRNDGKLPTDGLYAHCARELFQKQWGIMLDDELVDAMKNGLVILCPDGKHRCFYPRIFTYSADYPEKTLVAGLRNNGGCPCHRCLIEKSELWKLAAPIDTERENQRRDEEDQRMRVDLAREEIAARFAVDGARIDRHLKAHSLVPVHNAFSSRLSEMHFKIISALVVDVMHEFEIGAWKKLFIHLIRLLEAFASQNPKGSTLTADLDHRYRATPHFGRDAIRSFSQNASQMKRRAARDYEDLLQCAIPAFESLLPEPHNEMLMKLLFICAQWHALAKLRLHNDRTLQLLEYTTTWLGAQMRLFNRDTCSKITTKELQKESEAREKREGKANTGSTTRKPVKFNIFTIKWHFLGDYVPTIKLFGTTDSYSTETGELFHRLPKSWFERTDKREFETQLSQIERRRARLDQIRHANTACEQKDVSSVHGEQSTGEPDESDPPGICNAQSSSNAGLEKRSVRNEQVSSIVDDDDSPDRRYTIGTNQNSPLDIASFAHNPSMAHNDPYTVNFIQNLKKHLLPRIAGRLGLPPSASTEEDWINVSLTRLYSHKLMRINYTTYDVRRDQDIVHAGTPQSNVMLLNEASTDPLSPSYASIHPYLYAKVIGIYHANVSYVGKLPDGTQNLTAFRVDFVWIQWYDILEAGKEFSLDRLALRPVTNSDALGFLDPSDVVRAVHLVPQYSLGLPTSTSRSQRSKHVSTEDVWGAYYINKFADRDLFMRYQYGMSVGHTYMRKMHTSRMTIPSIPHDFEHYSAYPEGEDASAFGHEELYVDPPSDESDREEINDEL